MGSSFIAREICIVPQEEVHRRVEKLDYMQAMLGELRSMAHSERYEMLAYLIGMAHAEATELVRGERASRSSRPGADARPDGRDHDPTQTAGRSKK